MLAIKLRLFRTTLVDYHWSYDYIKISRLIKQDLRKRRLRMTRWFVFLGSNSYATGWKKDFEFFHFDYYSHFVRHCRPHWSGQCPGHGQGGMSGLSGELFCNDYTVLDEDKRILNPFTILWEGFGVLNHNDHGRPFRHFKKPESEAVFISVFNGFFISKIFGEGLTLFWTSQMIEQITLRYYDGDPK